MSYTTTLRETAKALVVKFSGAAQNESSSRSFVFTGTKSGERVDGWKGKLEKGQVASSPYYLDMTRLVLGKPERHVCGLRTTTLPKQNLLSGMSGYPAVHWQGGNTLTHLAADTVKARSMALSKLYKKLEEERSEMNASASLAEFGDVLRQFGRPFGSLLDAFRRHENRLYFERRRLKGRSSWKEEQFRRIAAETWLEVSFGLVPLISDAKALAETMARWRYELSDSPKLRDRIRARATDLKTALGATSEVTFFSIASTGSSKTETEARAQYVVGLKGDLQADFGSNDRLLELLGFEPRNIPLAVWEAIPWSWLVDYGTNVQQILQAGATITSRVDWIVLSETLKTTRTSWCRSHPYASAPWSIVYYESDKPSKPEDFQVRMIRTTFTRSIPATLGVPPLYFKSPLGEAQKVANLLAVAVAKSKDRRTWLS